MKKILSMLLLCCAVNVYGQQPKTPIDFLTADMNTAFKKIDTVHNFYNSVGLAALIALDPRTQNFFRAWKDLEPKYPALTSSALLKRVCDTVLNDFFVKHLWPSTYKVTDDNSVFVYNYQKRLQECMTPKLANVPDPWDKYMVIKNQCDEKILKDKKYRKEFEDYLIKIPKADRLKFMTVVNKYIFLTLSSFKSVQQFVYKHALSQYNDLVYRWVKYVVKEPLYFYNTRKTDSLALLFPAYKKFEQDLKSVIPLDTARYFVEEGPAFATSTNFTRVVTFYNIIPGGFKLRGQLTIGYETKKPVTITNYTFTPVVKLKNTDQLLKKAENDFYEWIFRSAMEGELDEEEDRW